MSARGITYAAERARLLDGIICALRDDESFVAAWLAGSFGRGEPDELSDLDLHVVVEDTVATVLCRRESIVMAGTTPERLEIVSRAGQPLIIHENHHNAPAGGTFTAVIYKNTAQQVDWTLIPYSRACKPLESVALLERIPVPTCPVTVAPDEDSRREQLAERLAFFWMMTVPTTKYALRGDAAYFHILFDMLDRAARDIEQLIHREVWTYQRGSRVTLHTSQQEQLDAIRHVCNRVKALEAAHGTTLSSSAMEAIDLLMSLDPT